MWVSAFFGMATKYAEAYLSVLYRYRSPDGAWVGGAMVYLERGVGGRLGRVLGRLFCLFAALAALGIGNMAQANAMAGALTQLYPLPPLAVGLCLLPALCLVLLGGAGRIGRVTERLVPAMACFYLCGALLAIWANRANLGRALGQIWQGAFSLQALGGGMAGTAMGRALRYGVARGVFSNEAGMGSATFAHGAAGSTDPVRQGYWGIFEVFADTILMCTVTALAILTAFDGGALPGLGLDGAALSMAALGSVFGRAGALAVALGLCLFAFSTIIGWYYYGSRAVAYLWGPGAIRPYCGLYLAATLAGCMAGMEGVWALSDILNGLMAIPNLAGLFLLSGVVARGSRERAKKGA